MEKRKSQEVFCKNCNNSFFTLVTDSNLLAGKHKIFCSLSCASSFNKTGSKNPMFGKEGWSKNRTKLTDERLKKLADNKMGEKHHYFNKKLSEEHKNKIKESLKNESFLAKVKKPIKEKYKEKYGSLWEIEYGKFLNSMKKVNTLEWFKNKFGEELGSLKYKERSDNLKIKSFFITNSSSLNKDSYSKISQELFWELHKTISPIYKKIFFAELNHEHSCSTGRYRFDFVVMDNKKIIEFNGNKFHPKELTKEDLKNWKTPHGIPGELILERDNIKKEKAELNGFEILYIWENEYKENKEKSIEKCLSFINNS